jgi:hypothetical protein
MGISGREPGPSKRTVQMYTEARCSADPLIEAIDGPNDVIASKELARLRGIAAYDKSGRWKNDQYRDMAHWLVARFGWRPWTARRRVHAAHALEKLPLMSLALETGELCEEKVLELARFANPETEKRLVKWAKRVTFGCVRERADLECAPPKEEAQKTDRDRSVRWWWYDEGRRFGLTADLPAAQGAQVAAIIDRLAAKIPSLPSDLETEDPLIGDLTRERTVDVRRADALVELCAGWRNKKSDKMATIHINVDLQTILDGDKNAAIEGGGVVPPAVLDMLLCDSKIQTILKEGPEVIGIGDTHHDPPPWLRRQVVLRDHCCTFPGCGMKTFVQVHHILGWPDGPTDLDNLTLVCHFHHKLIHLFGWRVALQDGIAIWLRPDGCRFEPEKARSTGPSRGPAAEKEASLNDAA